MRVEPALRWTQDKGRATKTRCYFAPDIAVQPELIQPGQIRVQKYANHPELVDRLLAPNKRDIDKFAGNVYFGLRISYLDSNGRAAERFVRLGFFMNNLPGVSTHRLNYEATLEPIHAIVLEPPGAFERLWRSILPDRDYGTFVVNC